MTLTQSLLLLLIVQSTTIIYGSRHKRFFRKDYTYLKPSSSFYKIHSKPRTWQDARRTCELEGANLFYAENEREIYAVLGLWNRTQSFPYVYIGISDLVVKGVFETIDGRPMWDVYNKWVARELNEKNELEDCVILRRDSAMNIVRCDIKYPFICKKSLNSMKWNKDCKIPYKGYVYSKDIGKCYKFHLKPRNWTDAYITCGFEESYLAVVDSQEEADFLVSLTANATKAKTMRKFLGGVVFLGFHNRHGDGWRTIKNVPLEESGYSKWWDDKEKEKCGSMFYNGYYNDMCCHRRCFFICEHDIKPYD